MNARIDIPSHDNVVSLLDLLEKSPVEAIPERQTVAQLQTLPGPGQPSANTVSRERTPVRPAMSPIELVQRAGRAGIVAAGIGAVCTLGYALASGTASVVQTPWLMAFVALMAFSFGASLGSVSSFVSQRSVAFARLRTERERRGQAPS
jgi:hypothetical protein